MPTGAAFSAPRCSIRRPVVAGVGEIALGDDDAVGERHLLFRLGHPLEIAFAVDGVDDRDQGLQVEFAAERPVGGKGLQYRTRIGEPGGLDDDPLEARHRAARAIGEQARASVSCRSVRTLQHRQPLPSSTVTSLLDRSSALSMPISPYSLTTTAVLAPSGLSSSARIRVVFPEPRKPVTAMTGSRGPRARRCGGRRAARPCRRTATPGPASEVHFEGVETSDMPVDGVDDLPLVDKHVVYLDRPARRPLRGRRARNSRFRPAGRGSRCRRRATRR